MLALNVSISRTQRIMYLLIRTDSDKARDPWEIFHVQQIVINPDEHVIITLSRIRRTDVGTFIWQKKIIMEIISDLNTIQLYPVQNILARW